MTGHAIWITGLPCSGKTTIANALSDRLRNRYGRNATIIDGDKIRKTISADLGFSRADRRTQMIRVATIAAHVVEAGGIAIIALVSPYSEERSECYRIIGNVIEVHTDAPRETCRHRDAKGMWAKADRGEIVGFTGHDAPYEDPQNPAVKLDTASKSVSESIDRIDTEMRRHGILPEAPYRLFIGRWSPFHNGHKHIVDMARIDGPVAIGVRCSDDAYDVGARINMIRAVYPDAHVFAMPDICSVHIGRRVGYDVVRYEVPDHVAGISATEIRAKKNAGDDSWRAMVPAEVAAVID